MYRDPDGHLNGFHSMNPETFPERHGYNELHRVGKQSVAEQLKRRHFPRVQLSRQEVMLNNWYPSE